MSIRWFATSLAALLLAVHAVNASAVTVLTTGKHAVFGPEKGRVRIGRDPRLSPLSDPQCGGVETRIQIAAYPQATNRLEPRPEVPLPCANWKRTGKGYVYKDPGGAAGGVTKVIYSRNRLQVRFDAPGYGPWTGPVGYAELWFTVGSTRFLARFHNFTTNTATKLVTVKASKLAAEGEALFWDVLLGDDPSDATQLRSLDLLGKAADRNRKDGRSPFLCGMMHLYRYGLFFDAAGQPTTASRAEVDAAVAAFDVAEPRLWNTETTAGDSRVPGFVAAAAFARGYAHGSDARMNDALDALQAAFEMNPFFNVFDLMTVLQALPASDPRWQQAYGDVVGYLEAPDTLGCVGAQPELCANEGLAPHNTGGALVLFGDIYAKAGNAEQAALWYGLAQAIGGTAQDPWPFQSIADERVLDVGNRVARYLDDDPSNDDPIVGVREENCAVCHNR